MKGNTGVGSPPGLDSRKPFGASILQGGGIYLERLVTVVKAHGSMEREAYTALVLIPLTCLSETWVKMWTVEFSNLQTEKNGKYTE